MATNDILTLAEAKDYLQVATSDQTKDTLIQSIITGVSTRMDRKFGPVVFSTVTAELHDGGAARNPYKYIYLDYTPVYSVTQIVEYDGTTPGTLTQQTNTSQPATSFTLNQKNGKVTRRNANADSVFPVGAGNVVVSYVAGRFTAGTVTDERYKICAGLALENVWRNQQPATANYGEYEVPQINWPKFVIPNAGIELLAEEVRQGRGF